MVSAKDARHRRPLAADGPVSSAGARLAGQLGMLWGVAGVSLLLLSAVFRLGAVALQTLRMDLDWWHWVACGISLVFLGITEGYMGFQRGFSPRVAARALHLKDNPQLWNVALAPVFCMGLIHATRRLLISSWILAVAVILIIIAVRALPHSGVASSIWAWPSLWHGASRPCGTSSHSGCAGRNCQCPRTRPDLGLASQNSGTPPVRPRCRVSNVHSAGERCTRGGRRLLRGRSGRRDAAPRTGSPSQAR